MTRPRPGHADLAGVVKYGHDDIRNVLERASARETAARVAVGAMARQLLVQVGTEIVSHVASIGSASLPDPLAVTFEDARGIGDDSPLHCVDADVERAMIAADRRGARRRRHDGRQLRGHRARRAARPRQPRAVGSQARRPPRAGADVDSGHQGRRHRPRPAASPSLPGSRIHDEILPRSGSSRASGLNVSRPTNNAGGLEGGITNGEDLRITGYMKPIATLMKPLRSVDLTTMAVSPAAIERSDVCAVPAAAVVGEAMVAIVLADALVEKFGGDSIDELLANWRAFQARTAARFTQSLTDDHDDNAEHAETAECKDRMPDADRQSNIRVISMGRRICMSRSR